MGKKDVQNVNLVDCRWRAQTPTRLQMLEKDDFLKFKPTLRKLTFESSKQLFKS